MPHPFIALCLAILGAMILPASGAPAFVPYSQDEHTLHLWHLDEAGPPFKDEGTSPTPLLGLLHGARSGQAPFPGFGAAVSFQRIPTPSTPGERYGPALMAKPMMDYGPRDNVDPPFPIAGSDGAFTFEALIRLDVMPSEAGGPALDIISMDDDIAENRVFIFRIEKPGFLCFLPISGNAVRGGGLATIPTTGPHALRTGEWFHAAVVYDGRETAVNNLKLYWTRLSAGNEAANLIGQGTLTADLSHALGDFAIGNSGKIAAPEFGEFFPGSIDEVRISSIARSPWDFCFVSEDVRTRAESIARTTPSAAPHFGLMLQQILIGETPASIPQYPDTLILEPGLHRIDFDFSFLPGTGADPLSVRCKLDGLEEEWLPVARGMTLEWEMLDARGDTITRRVFPVTGTSPGWQVDALSSTLLPRSEPLFIPGATRSIRVTASSGAPDTTGTWVIDDIALTQSRDPKTNVWENGSFSIGERINQIGGIPTGWQRRGTEPAIARVMQLPSQALGLVDGEQDHSGQWVCTQKLQILPNPNGETFLLRWKEAYNVIPGASLRATYRNVSPGTYTFRAMAVSQDNFPTTTQLTLPLRVREPFWNRPFFLPSLLSLGSLSIALLFFAAYRRRARRRLATIRLQHALERDRSRIARDMHDDLGTRVTMLNLAAAFVRRSIDSEPEKARQQVLRLESAARDLVHAMDGLVWAVNPANDNLDQLATHLSAVAQEIFRDSEIRLRIAIDENLPHISLHSDFRHHFALAIKEALHNILKHAGPCEAHFSLAVEQDHLVATISDSGRGFLTHSHPDGNGLANLQTRLVELHGSCSITSSPSQGTLIRLCCPLPSHHTHAKDTP